MHNFWRFVAPLLIVGCAFTGFTMGVGASERPDLGDHGPLAIIYYSLSLFVVGGVDLGTPIGGSDVARALVWFAYFAAPTYTTSSLAPQSCASCCAQPQTRAFCERQLP